MSDPMDNSIDQRLLDWARRDESKEAIRMLDKGANPNAQDRNRMTPLMFACNRNNAFLIKALLCAGADPNLEDLSGKTALHDAAKYSSLDCVIEILEAGADIEARDMYGYTPLIESVSNPDSRVFKHFLEHGADMHVVPDKGTTVAKRILATSKQDLMVEIINRGYAVDQDCYESGPEGLWSVLDQIKQKSWTKALSAFESQTLKKSISPRKNDQSNELGV